jgi:magnesium chelatase subunit I
MTPGFSKPTFPFTAIVGQEEMKHALVIAAIDPTIGGVLIFGDRGTGKSTAVRALAALLPPIKVVEGCAYNCDAGKPAGCCDACRAKLEAPTAARRAPVLKTRSVPAPVVDLPLGATEDRVAGALDIERALARSEKAFEPGLLARANRGFLYIDEVNLLEDHLVDLLLDVAASGENVIEREGLSIRHPARFVLIGSGNPEEGELRPQLLDRFGLSVDVTTSQDVAERVKAVKLRDAYDRDPAGFVAAQEPQEAALRRRIVAARKRLPLVETPDAIREAAAGLCVALGADGLRGEMTLLRAARAAAALDGKAEVAVSHIRAMAPSALRHRLRRNPLDDTGSGLRVARAMEDLAL